MSKLYNQLKEITNLSDHVDISATIESIKKSIDFRGPNVWILAFAIIMASVGLNLNSIPVIIGAMLISPLMGPIIGTGLAVGIDDSVLLRRSLKNLGIMVAISLIASTAFFALTPLNLDEPIELLARTRPTIYDVFIALFGGLAGIVELSRKDKGTVIAGVAIATALMPPLCTAGYGLANLNAPFFFGAIYLFFINSLFIALATFLVVRYLKFPLIKFADPAKQRRVRRAISIFALIMVIPSIYTAFLVIKENTFNQVAKKFVSEHKTMGSSYIFDYSINHKKKPSTLILSVAGDPLSQLQKDTMMTSLEKRGILKNQLIIKESERNDVLDENGFVKSIFERSDLEINKREVLIRNMESELKQLKSKEIPYKQIASEIIAQHPGIVSFSIARGAQVDIEKLDSKEQVIALIKWQKPLSGLEIIRLERWLSIRLKENNLMLVQIK
ncbi:MAG: hypothetical protein ACD_77C00325G0003 [uncultured bacterium]|nr:MAG: hypothetical protein ACD_77C00325G0003 [uncultured bacterium]HBY01045.1 hypothetical protein [Rikenellaceae bacterium]